jgi:VanZ family protein
MLKNKKLIIFWAAVLLWMLLIFTFSAQPGKQSDTLSKDVAKVVVETKDQTTTSSKTPIKKINISAALDHMVRKFAHFVVYMILGILIINAVLQMKKFKAKAYAIAPLLCVLYASSDEFHQIFVPGRTPLVTDVMIDSAGALVGIGLYWVVSRIEKRNTIW